MHCNMAFRIYKQVVYLEPAYNNVEYYIKVAVAYFVVGLQC